MGPSTVKTFIAPALNDVSLRGSGVPIATAQTTPLRIVVRCLGLAINGQSILVAFDASAFAGNLAETFEIPPTQSEAFVIAPRQTLYIASSGANPGKASYAISEAIGEVPGGPNFRASFLA